MATFSKRTNQNGSITIQAKVRRKGFKTRSATFAEMKDAKTWAKAQERELDKLQHFGTSDDEKTAALDTTTLGDVLRRYQRDVTPTHRAWRQETNRLKHLIARPMAKLPLSKVDASVIAAFRDERLKEVAPGTVIRDMTIMNTILNRARNEWNLPIPSIKVTKPKSPPARDQVLSANDERILLKYAAPELQQAIILALETGARQGELLNLKWRDIDLKKRTAHIAMSKNGHPRTIPLSSRAVQTLMSMPRGSNADPVLAHFHKGNSLRHRYLRLKDRLGINVCFHSLRHTCLTRLAKRGFSAAQLQVVSGHRSLAMLSRYLHVQATDIVALMDATEPARRKAS